MATILSISSRVVRGSVGNSAAGFILQRLGHRVFEVPTVIWNHHPGHGRPQGLVLGGGDLTALLERFTRPDWGGEIDVVMTGYMARAEQVAAAAGHIEAMRRNGLSPRVICDPVGGDAGGPYVDEDVRQAQRDRLVPLADVVTPNRHELALLTGMPIGTNAEIAQAARRLGRPAVVVTSAHALRRRHIANMLITPAQALFAETMEQPSAPNGTGDALTALYAAHLASGATPAEALRLATATVCDLVIEARRRGLDELPIAAAQDCLVQPRTEPQCGELKV